MKTIALLFENQPNIKLPKKSIKKLHEKLKSEFVVVDLNDFLNNNSDVQFNSFGDLLKIFNFSFYKFEINHLKKIQGVTYRNHWNNLDEIWFDVNPSAFKSAMRKEDKAYEPFVDTIKNISEFYSVNCNDSFSMLLNKYEDTFNNVVMTIDEIKEHTELDAENKRVIREIVQTFIAEFNSLTDVYEERRKLDKVTVSSSLKNRLEEELEFVNKIKTDWNSSSF